MASARHRTFQKNWILSLSSEQRVNKKSLQYTMNCVNDNKYLLGATALSVGALSLLRYTFKPVILNPTTSRSDEPSNKSTQTTASPKITTPPPSIPSPPERPSILHQSLWTDDDSSDKPLFSLNPDKFCSSIILWIHQDVDYNQTLRELKRLFEEYRVSGAVIHLIWRENEGDVALIQNILEKDMKQYITNDTANVMLEALKKWLYEGEHLNALFTASPEDVAQLIMEFPIQSLKKAIRTQNIDGKAFVENPDKIQMIFEEAIGWEKKECSLLRDVLLRRISFTEKQILEKIQRIGTETKPPIHQSLITKLKNRLAAEGNLESVHYKLRVDAVIDDGFRILVRDILDELLQSREIIDVDESNFISLFFETISGAMVMKTKDGKGQLPWRCPCCGNLNVHKVIGYRMVTNISTCSICGVTQCEAITMAIKGIPLPFQRQSSPSNSSGDQEFDDDETFIYQRAENKRYDLHSQAQRDGNLCPVLIHIAKLLLNQRRYLMDDVAKSVNMLDESLLKQWMAEYKEILLESANTILTELEPNKATAAMQIIQQRLNTNTDGLGDVLLHFGSNGNRKGFIGILKKDKAMKSGTAAKIYKAVLAELLNKTFLEEIKDTNIDQLHLYILQYHMRDASVPKKMVFQSFFYDVVHFDDSVHVILDCKRRKQLSPDHGNEKLKQLNRLYMFLCHSHEMDADTMEAMSPRAGSGKTESRDGHFMTDINFREEKVNSYAFGVHHNYIHMTPTFSSVREELMCNPECPESHDKFMRILLKAIKAFDDPQKIKEIFVRAREYGAKHGILRNEQVTMKHVMCIILYTDLSELSPYVRCLRVTYCLSHCEWNI